MSEITFKNKSIHTCGHLPKIGSKAPDFVLVTQDLENRTLAHFKGKRKLIATVPSLDTGVCSTMTKHMNDFAQTLPNAIVIVVSADLPFAQQRFCQMEKVQNVITLSMMRSKDFGKDYGILIEDGHLAGILARSLIILDNQDRVIYTELVSEITHEPNYPKAIKVLEK